MSSLFPPVLPGEPSYRSGEGPARERRLEELNRDYEDAPWLTVLVKLSGFLTVFVGSYAAMDLLFNLGHRVTAWGPPALILSALAGAHLSE